MALTKSSETAARILEAAYRRLASDGYARLNMRDVAVEAGVNHALIHYYFGSKDQLVIAVLEEANRRLLERQKQMYTAPGDFAAKWAQARAFYEEDLSSGFVRVQMELWAASLSNEALREQFVPHFMAWYRVIEDAVREALKHYRLELPVSPEALATWVVDFWFGMEFAMLLGIPDTQAHHQEALDAMQRLLAHFDQQASSQAALSTTDNRLT
ncbi:MAG: TetR/AcrR family transcriptional regulator [Chloroflexi bacterium]|nr:TetR/AcrR family transcriptional regulator [Chloroflexota bacterium]